jgi:[ribosomal protein S18]-alanine N-acetyltransferase
VGYVAAVASGSEAMIYSIAVSDMDRRRGIGRALMAAELNYLSKIKGISRVTLQVSVNNYAAQSLYKQFRFVETRRIRKYYPNGDDAWLMSLDIPKNS